MADPTSSNVLLAEPVRGGDSGVWDTPVNGNFTALDGMLGGQVSLALAAATTILLTMPATGTVSAAAGPNQSQNAVIKITGTLTGNAVLQVTMPREYIFDTTGLTVATSYVQIAPAAGTGTKVGLPPGELTKVWFDGTNVSLMGLGRVGSPLDLFGVSTTTPWMSACSTLPYLPRDGATYSTSVYPALGALLGSTFGGNGLTTFAVPDTRNRFMLPVDISGQGRVTSAGSGVDGTSVGVSGGSQFLQSHTHTATVTDPQHSHTETAAGSGGALTQILAAGSGNGANNNVQNTTAPASTGITVANVANGSGSSQNMPPVIVFGCGFIKT